MLERTRTTLMAGTSTALDVIYELTGRRLPLLQRGAAWLYEHAEGDHLDLKPFTQPPPPQPAPAAPPAPAPVKAAAPEAVEAKAVEAKAVEAEAVEAVEAAPASVEAEAAPDEATFPIEGYDDLSVKPILDALEGLSAAQLQQVLEREEGQKRRVTITRAIKKLMEA